MGGKSELVPPRWETPEPPGVTGTYGDRALRWAKRELGLVAGPWQQHVIRNILRHDKRGDIVARTSLVSTGRQNGKSVVVRIIVGWFLDEGRTLPPFRGWTQILAAAHDAKQARIIYEGVYADLAGIDRLVQASKGGRFGRTVKLTELFGIRVGSLNFDTVTSQPGSARGKSAGLIAFDEVMTQNDWDMWKALAPTQSAQRSPLILLTSTAGGPESVLLRSFYDRLVRQASGDDAPDPSFYGAWWQSEDPEAGLDWSQIEQANPALHDGRLSREFIQGEHAGPAEIWRAERLNHWTDVVAASAFGPGQWAAVRTVDPLRDVAGPFVLGVAVGPDWLRATITVASIRPDGRVGVAVYRDLRATAANPLTAEDVIEAVHSFEGFASAAVYDSVSAGAPAFRRDAEETGFAWEEMQPKAVIGACMDVAEMVQAGMLAVDDPLIDAQVATMGRRPVGLDGMFRFARSASSGPIDAALAMVYAAHSARFSQDFGIYIPA